MKNRVWIGLLVFAVLVLFSVCAAGAEKPQAKGKIVIGQAVSLSGPLAVSNAAVSAPYYDLWVKDVNAEGDPHLMKTLRSEGTEVIFSNVLKDPQGHPRWEGDGEDPPTGRAGSAHLISLEHHWMTGGCRTKNNARKIRIPFPLLVFHCGFIADKFLSSYREFGERIRDSMMILPEERF